MNSTPAVATHQVRAARFWRRLAYTLAALTVLVAGVYFAGPRLSFGPNQPTAREAPPTELTVLQDWLSASEQKVPGIRPHTEKRVTWAGPLASRTPWAVVYVHGFGASRLETAPLAQIVAKGLGANLFETRLTGHGQGSEPMGQARVQDWLADVTEAARIGAMLGERVLLISCSTGSTLGTWLGLERQGPAVDAQVFISPNFGPKDKRSDLLLGPWGEQLAYAIAGQTYGVAATDPAEKQAWTTPYPTRALFPMMTLVQKVRQSDLSQFSTPVLVFYSEADQTVDAALTRQAFERMGSKRKTLQVVTDSESKGQHVLAGDIRAPKSTQPMAQAILAWVGALSRSP